MKKIIAALSVTALALTAAFAADVTLEFTQKADFIGDNGKLRYSGYGSNSGCLVFGLKNDTTGVVLDIDPKIADTSRNYDSSDATAATYSEGDKGFFLDQYYGWVNFGDGAFKLQSGVWSSRSVNRLNQDAGRWEDPHYERYKLGVANGSAAQDVNNISGIYRDSTADFKNVLSTALQFKTEGFYATGILLSNDYDKASGLDPKSGWGLEAGLDLGEGNKLTVNFKNPAQYQYAIGAFFESKTLKENLDLVAGFTFGRNATAATSTTKATVGAIEYAFDLRARYDLADNMAITTMNNLSYFGLGQRYALWDMVSLAVTASDNLKVLMTVEWEHQDLLNANNTPNNTVGTLDFIPSVVYAAAEGVDLSAGLIMHTEGWSKPTTAGFEIPFILHVDL